MAKAWKNGVEQNLSDGTNRTEADCVFAHGADVYVGGQDSSYAVIWKNGVVQKLSNGASSAIVRSIYVTGTGDIFAAGQEVISGKNYGRVWKNGTVYFTASKISTFSSLFVKE